jgi:predicted RNA methylase
MRRVGTKQIEQQRLALQAELDAAKSQADRNRMGQFATPSPLALDILDYARAALDPDEPVRFLDPAIGTGAFYTALRSVFPARRIVVATGFEIDPHYGRPAAALWRDTGLDLRLADFTTATPEAAYNLIICNPPYVRHHHVINGEKLRLQHAAAQACGVRIGGLAGLYCYFIALAHAWMAEGGLAGWLIPSEFMDVNYGQQVKRYMLERTTLLHIHRFDPADVQFDDALVSSAVVWFRKAPPPPGHSVRFTFGGTLRAPKSERRVSAAALTEELKWTRFPTAAPRSKTALPTIDDFFSIKRGLATGDNRYFILTPEEIEERGLPREMFRPILPSPRYLPTDEIEADKHGNPLISQRLFLLDCRLPEDEVKKKYPRLWAYFEQGSNSAITTRYLCRHRSPWYVQENRPPAPFVCTYLGRNNTARGRPFRFILNRSAATVANVYLALYPKLHLARALAENPGLDREIWKALNSITSEELLGEGRVYGGGLHKLEPKELANVPVSGIAAIVPDVGRLHRQGELFVGAAE